MNIEISPKSVFARLLIIVAVLLSLNIIGIISSYGFNHNSVHGLVALFDFDTEANIPTFFSALVLLFASILLSMIALTHQKNGSAYLPWLILAFIFLFLSIDEITMMHERLVLPVRESLNTSGLLYSAWVIPYGIGLIIFVLAYLRFLIRLPRNISILFIVSGSLFALGALGFELLEGRLYELNESKTLMLSLLCMCEETLEMVGTVTFIYALQTYIVCQFKSPTIRISDTQGKKRWGERRDSNPRPPEPQSGALTN